MGKYPRDKAAIASAAAMIKGVWGYVRPYYLLGQRHFALALPERLGSVGVERGEQR